MDDYPGREGAQGPFPDDYAKPHMYARDVHSGAGNCVCGAGPDDHVHVELAPGTPNPLYVPEPGLEEVYARFAQTWNFDQFAQDIEAYWKTGKGAAKIHWGSPGDWTRCYRHLSKPDKPLGPERAKRICAQWHKDMTGVWPGSKLNK